MTSSGILMLGEQPTYFEIIGEIRQVATIAAGSALRVQQRLGRVYGKGRWRKMKGIATVKLADGTVCEAEIHWYEAHGIGRREFKIKRVIG